MDDERHRQRIWEFTVQSLVFTFHVLAHDGFVPVIDDETRGFWMELDTGDEIAGEHLDVLAKRLKEIKVYAPLGVSALEQRGKATDTGIFAGAVLAEAYDRFQKERD